MIAEFLSEHPDFRVVPVEHSEFFSPGETDWMAGEGNVKDDLLKRLAGTARLWPHKVRGEGHFMAVLQRDGELDKREVEREQAPLFIRAPWPTSRLLFPPERSIPESVKEKRLSGGAPG